MQLEARLNSLRAFNQSIFAPEQIKLLTMLSSLWEKTKPLAGIKILHNIPLTQITVVKLESLLAAGADVTVTHTLFTPTPPEREIISALEQAGMKFVLSHQELAGEYDIALDCCAEVLAMDNVFIRKGIVELTQTGGEIYKTMKLDLPVINVDDSHLKKLEGMYGTGEGFVRAIKQSQQDIHNKAFVVFGYGKVGRGIARYLSHETSDITIVDASDIQLEKAQAKGFQTVSIQDIQAVRDSVKRAFCVVMATGKKAALSSLVSQTDCQSALLTNMGTEDEIGQQLQGDNILNNRMAINFSLKLPTLPNYIDPVFYAHNLAAQLLIENNYKPGYYPFPSYLDDLIIKLWQFCNTVDISDLYE